MEIINAKITSTSITMADHGCLIFWVTVEGSGFAVSIGGYSIGHGYLGASEFDGNGHGLEAMMRIMDTVGIDTWEDLKGKYIRIESNGLGKPVKKIGHLIDNKWFDIDEFFKSKAKGGAE